MPDVFVTHGESDREAARAVCELLAKLGISSQLPGPGSGAEASPAHGEGEAEAPAPGPEGGHVVAAVCSEAAGEDTRVQEDVAKAASLGLEVHPITQRWRARGVGGVVLRPVDEPGWRGDLPDQPSVGVLTFGICPTAGVALPPHPHLLRRHKKPQRPNRNTAMKRTRTLLLAGLLLPLTAAMTQCNSSDPYTTSSYGRPAYGGGRYSTGAVRASSSSSSYYYDAGPYYTSPSYNSSSGYYYGGGSGYTKPAGVSGGTSYSSDSPEGFDAVSPPATYSY